MRAFSPLMALLILLMVPTNSGAFSDGPPDGYANNPPALNTCISCHDSFDLNSGLGGVLIGFSYINYVPSTLYEFPVVMGHTGLDRWGFQMTALDTDNESAGVFIPNLDSLTVISDYSPPEPDYIGQNDAGTFHGQDFGMWNVRWISPPAGTGPVTMYSSGMGSDGDGTSANDYVYSFALELAEAPGGIDAPIAYMETSFHDYGNVPIGTGRTWTEELYSIGSEPIVFADWGWVDNGPFSVIAPQLPVILSSGESVDLTIEFTPEFTGNWQDSLDFGLPESHGISGLTVRGEGTFALQPEPFHLLSPVDGELVGGDSIRFIWQSTVNPDSIDPIALFDIEIDTESDFSSSVFYDAGSDTSFTLSASEFMDSELYFWRVYARDTNTPGTYSDEVWAFLTDFTSVNENGSPAVADDPFMVHIWPNPFNELVSITFALPHPTQVQVEVLDLLGRRVAVLHSGPLGAGNHTLQWSGDQASGVYLVRIARSGSATVHRKMVLLR